MTDTEIEFGSEQWGVLMDMVYGEQYSKFFDIIERNDIYSASGEDGLIFLADKLGLTHDSHVLDLASGAGGPARFLAKKYHCHVSGIDISKSNHQTAETRTTEVGLDHLVTFVHGNALDIPFPDHSFTHVIGCDAWLYFPDKLQLYKAAYQALKPEGLISFLEPVRDTPKRMLFEDNIGKCSIESVTDHTSKLKAAGFESVQHFDISEITCKEIVRVLYKGITKKNEILESFGSTDFYFLTMEFWVESLVKLLEEEEFTEQCFVAKKK